MSRNYPITLNGSSKSGRLILLVQNSESKKSGVDASSEGKKSGVDASCVKLGEHA